MHQSTQLLCQIVVPSILGLTARGIPDFGLDIPDFGINNFFILPPTLDQHALNVGAARTWDRRAVQLCVGGFRAHRRVHRNLLCIHICEIPDGVHAQVIGDG